MKLMPANIPASNISYKFSREMTICWLSRNIWLFSVIVMKVSQLAAMFSMPVVINGIMQYES
jgi:hypothetical protein